MSRIETYNKALQLLEDNDILLLGIDMLEWTTTANTALMLAWNEGLSITGEYSIESILQRRELPIRSQVWKICTRYTDGGKRGPPSFNMPFLYRQDRMLTRRDYKIIRNVHNEKSEYDYQSDACAALMGRGMSEVLPLMNDLARKTGFGLVSRRELIYLEATKRAKDTK